MASVGQGLGLYPRLPRRPEPPTAAYITLQVLPAPRPSLLLRHSAAPKSEFTSCTPSCLCSVSPVLLPRVRECQDWGPALTCGCFVMQMSQESPFCFLSEGLALWDPGSGKSWKLSGHWGHSFFTTFFLQTSATERGHREPAGIQAQLLAAERSLKRGKRQQALLSTLCPGWRVWLLALELWPPEPGPGTPPRLQEEPRHREQRLGSPWGRPWRPAHR